MGERRDATRPYISQSKTPGLPAGLPCTPAGIAEHMRGHALYYWHPAEREFGHGPGSPTGTWPWNLAEKIAADGTAEAKPLRSGARVPRQRDHDHDDIRQALSTRH